MNMMKRGFWIGLAVLALAAAGCSAEAKKARHLQRADKLYAAGQYSSAEIEYLNVLGRDPQNVRAFSQLGQIYYQAGRLQRAAFFLNKASDLATNDVDLKLKLGNIYSAVGAYDQARTAANFALQRQPTNDDAAILLSETAVKPKEIATIREQFQRLIGAGDRPALEVAIGNLAFHEHDLVQAGTAYQRAYALDAKSPAVLSALAAWYWAQTDLKQAETFFKAASEASPARSPRRMQYARFRIQNGDLVAGRQLLAEIIKAAPDCIPPQMVLAEIAATEKKYDEASQIVAGVLQQEPDDFDALLFNAQLKLVQGQTEVAIQQLERVTRLYPQAVRAQYQLAQACLAENDPAKAATVLTQAINLEPNYLDAVLLLAQIRIRAGNADLVVVALEPVVRKYPQLVQARLLLADAYRMLDRTRDALAIYEPLEKALPDNPQISLLIGAAYQQLGDTDRAREAFNRVLKIAPDNRAALEQLLNLDLAANNFSQALQRVDQELAKTPQDVVLHLFRAKVFLAQKKSDEAEAALLKAVEVKPEDLSAYLLLAQLYYETQQSQKALAKLDIALAKNPRDLSVLMLQAVIHNANKEYQVAADTYEKLLAVSPHCRPAINNLAYLYSVNLNRIDRAYELAQQARELMPFDPSTADTLGWVSFQRGAYPVAYGLLKESAAKLPGDPEVQYHFGMACYQMSDEAAAQAAFAQALKSKTDFAGRDECLRSQEILAINPQTATDDDQAKLEKRLAQRSDDSIALARLATIWQRTGKTSQAINAYESILRVNPNHLPSMIALATLYTDSHKAYDMARSAYKLAPENPLVAHTFGQLAAQTGDYKLALSILQPAVQRSPDEAALLLDYAQVLFAVGKLSQSQEALQNALTAGLGTNAPAVSRRLEMLKLAANPAAAVAAQTRITEGLQADAGDDYTLLASAVAAGQRGDLPTAQAAFEKILAKYPDFSPAQRQLAVIYARDPSRLDQSYALAIKAREANPNDAVLAKTLGVVLVQKADYARALPLLKQAVTTMANDAELQYYLGLAHYRLKNRTESKVALQQALTLNLTGKAADDARQMLTELK